MAVGRNFIAELLQSGVRPCISGDLWSDSGMGLFGIYAHGVTADFELKQCLIALHACESERHTAANIRRWTIDALQILGITAKEMVARATPLAAPTRDSRAAERLSYDVRTVLGDRLILLTEQEAERLGIDDDSLSADFIWRKVLFLSCTLLSCTLPALLHSPSYLHLSCTLPPTLSKRSSLSTHTPYRAVGQRQWFEHQGSMGRQQRELEWLRLPHARACDDPLHPLREEPRCRCGGPGSCREREGDVFES